MTTEQEIDVLVLDLEAVETPLTMRAAGLLRRQREELRRERLISVGLFRAWREESKKN